MYSIQLTKLAAEYIKKLDKKSKIQIVSKIESLKENPETLGKALKGNLKKYRSIRSVGQRYRIIYQVENKNVVVLVIAVGIRKDGDKKDIYELMKKYIKTGLLKEEN